MKNRMGFIQIISLLVLSLFLAEYLNPSAIGVRADCPLLKAPAAEAGRDLPGERENASTAHAMIWIFPLSVEQAPFNSSIKFDQPTFRLPLRQDEIDHPPVLI